MYSAKKIGGKKLYELARKNIEVEREAVKINILSLELIDFNADTINFRVDCSKGTYIRVLGSDIANELGSVGHLIKLVRNSVGDYNIDESIDINVFEEHVKQQLLLQEA